MRKIPGENETLSLQLKPQEQINSKIQEKEILEPELFLRQRDVATQTPLPYREFDVSKLSRELRNVRDEIITEMKESDKILNLTLIL